MTRRRTRRLGSTAEILDRLLTEIYACNSEGAEVVELEPAPEPAATLQGGAKERLASRALGAARALLAQLERWRPEDERAVARLLAKPVPERWRLAVAESTFHRPEVVELLVSSAGACGSRPGTDAEESSLLALHLCERLNPGSYPEGLVSDLFCRALAVRVEHLIARRRLRAAEIALFRTQELLLASSDPLVAQDVGLASAWLHWAEGHREAALALLNDLGRLAGVLGEVGRVGELSLWSCMLFQELGAPDAAAGLEARAEDVLGASAVEERWAKVRAKHKALRLDRAPVRAEGGLPTFH